MKYEIIGDTLPVVELELDRGEQIYTESGLSLIHISCSSLGSLSNSVSVIFSNFVSFSCNKPIRLPPFS